jgi:hypothetical protein
MASSSGRRTTLMLSTLNVTLRDLIASRLAKDVVLAGVVVFVLSMTTPPLKANECEIDCQDQFSYGMLLCNANFGGNIDALFACEEMENQLYETCEGGCI